MLSNSEEDAGQPSGDHETPVSLGQLGELLALVCQRPPVRLLPFGRGGDQQLPIVVVKVADGAERDRVADQIERWCTTARPSPVPAIRCAAPDGDSLGTSLKQELAFIRRGLKEPTFGKLPRYRFPRSELTTTVVRFAERDGGEDVRKSLVTELVRKDRLARAMRAAPRMQQTADPDDAQQPDAGPAGPVRWGKIAAFLADGLALLARPVLLWRLRTRLARLGGQYYWFRTNINANRGMEADTNFFSPAFFLLDMARRNRTAFDDYSSRQLTSAMLEDLQQGYRRGLSPWRGWARPVYPALILDEIPSGSARARLLLQINHDRMEGRWDPLLVIAIVTDRASYAALQRDARADTAGAGNGGVSLAGMTPADLYKQWSSQFPGAMRPVAPNGWFLFLSLDDSAQARNQAAGGRRPRTALSTRRRPLWTQVPNQVLALVLTAALATFSVHQWRQSQHQAQDLSRAAFQEKFCALGVWRLADGQCVGLAPPGFEFGMHDWTASLVAGTAVKPGTQRIKGDLTVSQLEEDIDHENDIVRQQAADGKNTVVTIAYIGPLTLPGDVSNPQTDGVRELAGVYAAQLAWDGTPEDGVQNDPLVQILVANAGASMQGQYQVAQQIIQLADTPVVGVIGVGMNEPSTPDTVSALGRAGVPIVGTTNSMDAQYPFYFQLAPDDRREAQVGVDYLGTLPGRIYGVRMVDTTSGYTSELGADVAAELSPAAQRAMPQLTYQSPRQLPGLVDRACQETGGRLNLIYYLGRSQDLPWLITQGLADSAQCANNHVTILSGDDASKYAAPLPGNITLDYTALTFPPAWQTCYHDSNLPPFYTTYLRWLQTQGIGNLPRNPLENPLLTDGHTVLGYDATMVMENATTQVLDDLAGQAPDPGQSPGIRMTPGDVWGQLRSAAQPPGASGLITFQPGFEQHKFVPVVQVKAQAAPRVVYAEGVLTPGSPTTCPGPGNQPAG